MKHYTSLLLLVAILLSLAACNHVDTPATEPGTEPPVEQNTTEYPFIVDPVYENMHSISMPITTETYQNADGQTIFTYSYQSMHLIIPDRDVADKIIIDFLSRIETSHEDADDLHRYAQEAIIGEHPFSYQIQYNTKRIDQGVLSLYGQIIQSSDAMHAGYECISASYDMITGDVLTLGSILYHENAKDELLQLILFRLENLTDITLYDDYRETVLHSFETDESINEAFYFTPSGLCFYFSPYEIAPYSVGPVSVEIPYSQLTGIIGDAYFPAERTYTTGAISVSDFNDVNLEEYENFAEIIAQSNGTKVLLTTDSFAQDVQIHQLVWSEYSPTYMQANTIFSAKTLSDKDAVLFEADFQGDKPLFMLTYTRIRWN